MTMQACSASSLSVQSDVSEGGVGGSHYRGVGGFSLSVGVRYVAVWQVPPITALLEEVEGRLHVDVSVHAHYLGAGLSPQQGKEKSKMHYRKWERSGEGNT